jgi:Fungal chitosanase of glycosyl hydrolase group 75
LMKSPSIKSGLAVVLLAILISSVPVASRPACKKSKLFSAQNIIAWSASSVGGGFFYKSGLAIDADGAARAYHPKDRLGLDSLAHAGHRGNWWALVTDNEKTSGTPVVQGTADPAPGYYVSTTALYDRANPNPRDPHRYVDATNIPYIVLHPKGLRHAQLGDFGTVVNMHNGKFSAAIVADVSAPHLAVGEGSISLAEALGVDSSPRHGGQDGGVVYLIYPGSGNGRPRKLEEILARGNQLFEAWGGFEKLNACLASE